MSIDWGGIVSKYGPTAVSLGAAVASGKSQGKANDLTDKGLAQAQQQYDDRLPFRQFALQGINAANARVDSGSLFNNKANPFSKAHDWSQDLGAGRQPNIDMTAINAQIGKQNAQNQVDAGVYPEPTRPMNDGDFHGLPVAQGPVARRYDPATTARDAHGNGGSAPPVRIGPSAPPMPDPQDPNAGPNAGPSPMAMHQMQFLNRYQRMRQPTQGAI